ncbi:MAG: protoheme IX farnesyltransferase [Spirochaetia bacterium]|nr:protoheme IX farnesyltransferase [Spirochaetia bacterium]
MIPHHPVARVRSVQLYLSGLFKLTKPEIVFLVLITVMAGYWLAASVHGESIHWRALIAAILGSALSCAGVAALNQVIEWRRDAAMPRTARRPIPSGLVSPFIAGCFGGLLWSAGLGVLFHEISFGMALGSLLTGLLYLLVYIPLKSVTALNTTIGAVPGALPILGGWYALHGTLSPAAWLLFLILFLWQHAHFYVIAWMYRSDYEEGGFRMLSRGDKSGRLTFWAIWISSVLLAVSVLALAPWVRHHLAYLAGGVLLTLWFGRSLLKATRTKNPADSKNFLKVTAFYIQFWFVLILASSAHW